MYNNNLVSPDISQEYRMNYVVPKWYEIGNVLGNRATPFFIILQTKRIENEYQLSSRWNTPCHDKRNSICNISRFKLISFYNQDKTRYDTIYALAF